VPLIINTHGWVKGMGLDICYEVIKFSKPTHIFQFHSVDQEIHNLPAFPTDLISSLKMTNESTALKIIKLEFFDNSTISNKRYTSSDYRTLNMVFYFHGNYNNGTQDDGNDEWWQFRKPLVRHLPWCLNWKRCLTKGVMLMSEEIPPKYNLKRSTLPSFLVGHIYNDEKENVEWWSNSIIQGKSMVEVLWLV
ncbi:6543_t:CDS:2, partial [Entrophospora sp. SA101]